MRLIATAVDRQFGLEGDYEPLVSERDQNFRLTLDDGRRFVVKVTNLHEAAATSDFQIGALLHLERANVVVPSVVRTLDGNTHGYVGGEEGRHRLRIVTWVEGETLLAAGVQAARAARLGGALARLDIALSGYSYAGETPNLLWDLQRTGELRPLLGVIDDVAIRKAVACVIDDFETRVMPVAKQMPVQVIHGDANPENVLVTGDGIGFIDFGDMVRAPRIFDLAVAAAYLRCIDGDPLVHIRPLVEGYQAISPLREDEIRLLFDLVRARLATTVTLLYWRLRDRPPEDDYRRKSLRVEGKASQFLGALDRMGRSGFDLEIADLLA